MIEYKNMNGASPDMRLAKRPYTAPKLLVFGQVAALTCGASTCGDNDSASCTPGATNMGEKAAKL